MCGIVAICGHGAGRYAATVDDMLACLAHRGPDDQGVLLKEDVALGQKRLSIMDVAGGHQPIFTGDRRKCIVCNGEIYNHPALKKQLSGHKFRTNSDTESILHLFEEEGKASLPRLDGMFAFVLYDGRDILVARDPLGIKPLYQGSKDNLLFFASEIKALEGVVDSIREFPAGHYYSSKTGDYTRYYQIPRHTREEQDIDTITATIRKKLTRAVEKRLMSDVPLGVFLSGGIDSSIIASVARRYLDPLSSFSVGMAGSPDLGYARRVAEFLGTDHHEYVYTQDEVLEILPEVIYHLESYDPPLVRSAIPTFFVSRLASKYVKVILTGEGSDELFAGYRYFEDIDEEKTLHDESVRIVSGLHNLNLQRVDRITMAHSLEGRVPFLDLDFVAYVLAIDPRLKLSDEDTMEKWLLRKAFSGYLPDEVLSRTKMEFADGCGSSQLITRYVEEAISDAEFQAERQPAEHIQLASKEELYYFRIFQSFFRTPGLHQAIGRWRGSHLKDDSRA
ncbi:MAG: asparagine synthase B [Dehalococcoidales bacterium]|nr:asparagine synthase B [Dehalococcoidales bacterium]